MFLDLVGEVVVLYIVWVCGYYGLMVWWEGWWEDGE